LIGAPFDRRPISRQLARAGRLDAEEEQLMKYIVIALAAAVLWTTGIAGAHAQGAFPAKPLRLIVPFPPGGGTDIVGRTVAQKLSEAWGQPVVVENRPGAAASIGTALVANSPPDGYTFGVVTSTFTMSPSLKKLTYDTLKDFTPLILMATVPNVLVVHPSLPVKSVQELVRLARARPDDLSYGTSGNGSVPHLTMELFRSMTGIRVVHVPYKGNPPAVTDLVGGHIQLMFVAIPSVHGQITAGRVRAIAVSSARRSASLPGVPSVAESGVPGYDVASGFGLVAPAGVPPAIVTRLNAEIGRILALPEVKERLASQGADPAGGSAADYAAYIRSEVARWSKVVREAGIRSD
jgi:tripartite-type tricarboxylate transporter receptor subunit TctC